MVILSDLIQRDQWEREVLQASIRKSVFWQSGIIQNDATLSKLMKAGVGSKFEFDYYKDLLDNEGRISDDSGTIAGTDGITTGTDIAVGNYRNRSWGARNITSSLSSTGDPMTAIAGRVGAYWARQMDFTAMAIVTGLEADNIANNASDFVNDQSATAVDINMIIDTVQTAGDAKDGLNSMICHSAIQSALKKAGVTDRIYDVNTGEFLYESLSGVRLVVTDSVPLVGGVYTSYIVGGGLIGAGDGAPKRPSEVDYVAGIGNGAGEESLWSRKEFCLHPYGFSFTGAPASTSPTNAEFEAAAAWTRNVERKRVNLAILKSLA